MDFELEFPTLAQWSKKPEASIGPVGEPEHMKGHIYYWSEVSAACKDNAKIKEAIENAFSVGSLQSREEIKTRLLALLKLH